MSAGSEALVHRVRGATGEPDGALVLLHGRGADEHDLVPLLELLDPRGRLVCVTPKGPLSLPPGGAHWYAVRRIGYPDPGTFGPVLDQLARWLDSLPETLGVPIARTVVGGFSQGAVMSYALGLARGRPAPAGILGLSGFIPTVDGLDLDLDDRSDLPVAIGHGVHDPVIGVEWGRDARRRLEGAGAMVTYRETPMDHTIDPRFAEELASWIAQAVRERSG